MQNGLEPGTFVFSKSRHQLPDAVLLGALRAFAAAHPGERVTVEGFRLWKERPCGVNTIVSRFGTWSGALRRVGLRPGKVWSHDAEELIANLESVWRRLGRVPGRRMLARMGELPAAPYEKRWGTVAAACRRLSLYHAGVMTREELLRPAPAEERGRVRAALAPGQRWRVLERDGHRCVACGRGARGGLVLHVDHITPVCRGGGNEEGNLRTLCRECNLGRGARGPKRPPVGSVTPEPNPDMLRPAHGGGER